MAQETFYTTTPIYYVNDKPHLGHAYTTIMCDVLRRYHDLLGKDTFFLTGTDEHGENIFRVAKQAGRDVRELVEANSQLYRNLWPPLNISNDDFIRTTEERHKKVVSEILQRTYDAGDIYEAEYGGNYCVKCERFYTDKETEEKPGFCPIHESELEYIKEKNYFFRLSKHREWLQEKIETDPAFLSPAQFRTEVLALLRHPLEDLCISRPVERMRWGIPLPFDGNFVTYVWYDALTNYISAIGYPDDEKFKRYWPSSMHLIAKDILRQHAVYWPCMLRAAGIPPFRALRVHGWWTVEGKKMSKSLGNVVQPLEEAEKYGLDAFRYFLAREMSFGSDGDYKAKGLVGRNNAELADALGNLLSRVTAMIGKYCGERMPALKNPTPEDEALLARLDHLLKDLPQHLEETTVHAFLEKVMQTVAATNRYVTNQAPWALSKKGESERVGTILAVASAMLAGSAQMLWPVMPAKMEELLAAFSVARPQRFRFGPVQEGAAVRQVRSLFPQIALAELGDETGPAGEREVAKSAVASIKNEISFEDFMKVDLRVATILEAEKVPGTDKLLRLQIDLGVEKRQIVAGVAEQYEPQGLVGRQIVVVANLAPRKVRGLESQGMLLAAPCGDGFTLVGLDREAAPGAEVS